MNLKESAASLFRLLYRSGLRGAASPAQLAACEPNDGTRRAALKMLYSAGLAQPLTLVGAYRITPFGALLVESEEPRD